MSSISEETLRSDSEEIDIERPKRGGGRPKNEVWQYFKRINTKFPGKFEAECKFCGQYWKVAIVKKLQVHLARECESVDTNIKSKYMYIVAKRDGLESTEVNALQININQEESNKDEKLSEEAAALIDRSVLKSFVMCGIPFRVIENPYFINMLKNLQSKYNLLSRERLSTNLLDEESVRVDIKIINSLENAKNLTLGMKLCYYFILLN